MKKNKLLLLLALALTVCTIFGIMVFSASAAEADHPHTESTTHCTCGGLGAVGDHKTCADVTWTAWTNGMTTPTKGNYYLAEDVTISAAISLSGNFKLCLNGYTLTVEGGVRAFTYVSDSYRTLDICDCSVAQSGKVTTANKSNQGGVVYLGRGKFCLYGGTLENTADMTANGGVIRLGQQDTTTGKAVDFRIYGGKICGTTTTKNGGSIYAKDGDSNIKMYLFGGTISGGSAAGGGNIYVGNGYLYLRGTTISGGVASGSGGNIYCTGAMEMTAGWIYGGSASATNGDNVRIQNPTGSLTMSGGYIGEVDQTAANKGHNLSVLNASFTMTGGTIKGLARVNATTSASVNLSGDARITGADQNLLISADAVTVTVGELTDKASVGITVDASMTTNVFATASADPNGKIFSDNKYYQITYTDGQLERVAKTMQVGYSKVSIAPAVGTPLDGYSNSAERLSTGDDENAGLCATVVAITDSEGETLLLITADLVNITQTVTAAAREAITTATGVPADHIMIAATHTHAAPDLTLSGNEAINTYKTELYANLTAAAEAAIADQAAATAAIGSVEISGQNYIRHYTDAEGNYYGYEHWASDAIKAGTALTHAAEADCTMQLLKFDRGDKTPVVIANWQAHPNVLGNVDYASADFVGAFRNALTDWNVAYFSGASGNVNPTSLVDTNDKTYITMGQAMAEVAAAAEFTNAGLDTIETKQTQYAVTYKDVTEEQYHAAVAFLAGENTGWDAAQAAGFNSAYEARTIKYVYEQKQTAATAKLELNAISLGSVAFVTAPYEMFDANGQTIKASESHEMTFVLTQANARSGYIPSDLSDKTIHETGVYELDSTKFVAGTGEELANAYLSMLAELVNEDYCICGGEKGGKPNHVCADVSWQAFPENGKLPTSGNFYLSCDLEISFAGTQACAVDGNLAIDLNGHTLTVIPTNGGRVFALGEGDAFSICDSVGGGQLVVTGNTTQMGGVIFNNKGTVCIFGGTIDASGLSSTKDAVVIRNAASSTCYIYAGTIIGGTTTANGGAITNAGTLYTYDGTIQGGKAANGGNIYNTGTLRLTGKLTGGVAAENGGNLYTNDGNTWVYSRIGEGEAVQGGNIYHAQGGLYLFNAELRNAVNGGGIYAAANFTVGGTAKTVANKMDDATVNAYLAEGVTITAGTSSTPLHADASIGITMADQEAAFAVQTANYAQGVEAGDVFFYQSGGYGAYENAGKLYFRGYAAQAYYKDGSEYKSQGYFSIEEAMAHEGMIYVALRADHTGDLSITSDLYLDLAGYSINGTVNVAEGATLYGLDSATDDYEGEYGKITAIRGNYAMVHGEKLTTDTKRYVTITEADGISFHRYYAALTAVSLKPDSDALGYKATFRGDEQVRAAVTGFGFNMWVESGNAKTYMKDGSFTDGQVLTLRLQNILASNGGEMNISAQAVVKFSHVDELAVGSKQTTTMKAVLQSVNAAWENYDHAQKEAVQTLCGKYDITKSWELNNILPTT